MRNFWLIAKAEYVRMAHRRSFVLATLGIPLLIVGVMAISVVLAERSQPGVTSVGYVDLAGVLTTPAPRTMYADDNTPEMRAFADPQAASSALTQGEIGVYYVIPADYATNRRVLMRYWTDPPGENTARAFARFMRASLVQDQPPEIRNQLLRGINITSRTLQQGRERAGEDVPGLIFPLVLGMFFVFVVMGSGGYLLQAVTTEKENRTVEVMFTSVSPLQLIGGKALGLMGVALTQIGVWLLALVVGLVVAANYVDFLAGFTIPWMFLVVMALFFLPSYALVAGIMITVGSMVEDLQQGQQISGLVNLLFLVPFFLIVLVFTEPNSPILVGLTLFPTTSFMTIAMRWGAATVPLWQMIVGWVLVVLTAVLSIVVAARVFRVGMLNYGQNIDLRRLAGIVRGRTNAGRTEMRGA